MVYFKKLKVTELRGIREWDTWNWREEQIRVRINPKSLSASPVPVQWRLGARKKSLQRNPRGTSWPEPISSHRCLISPEAAFTDIGRASGNNRNIPKIGPQRNNRTRYRDRVSIISIQLSRPPASSSWIEGPRTGLRSSGSQARAKHGTVTLQAVCVAIPYLSLHLCNPRFIADDYARMEVRGGGGGVSPSGARPVRDIERSLSIDVATPSSIYPLSMVIQLSLTRLPSLASSRPLLAEAFLSARSGLPGDTGIWFRIHFSGTPFLTR